ncbi:hypothetical protein [Mycobacterium aquaticum]|uniref:Uncharacterized protein n=1 Tax=Mycobacterium aquaticum TaxID=1927124 RepID=A0A1X0B8P7_9MYCO|nr:hypothetical protein [Mycobacterium aquaticum]ORA38710.1 hypothetical protein BST13_04840 [Mycobacterium aquaticum]
MTDNDAPGAWPDEEPEAVDRWTLADQDNEDFTSAVDTFWRDTGHVGELWLGDGDYEGSGANKTRKLPSAVVRVCACGWPLPIRWHWRACEFGGPCAWRTTNPEAEAVLDDDPLLYRIAPWLWTFCRCNGCVGISRQRGRPPERCTKCDRDARNEWRRERYQIVTRITAEMIDKQPVFVL